MAAESPEHEFMSEDEDENDDEFLQELYAAGKLKPGLNYAVPIKNYINNVDELNAAYERLKDGLPWIERLDLINDMAVLAPELCVELKEQEQFVESGRSNPLALNEFKRETLFHRQAQLAAMEGMSRLKSLGVPTLRPDDYFAEMMKSDDHMQKVRRSLLQRQAGLERSEKIKKMRLEKKLAKQKKVETTLRKQKEKRTLNEEIKKYRKGARADLDFLENKPSHKKPSPNKKRQRKNEKFGFGDKKEKFGAGGRKKSEFGAGSKKKNKFGSPDKKDKFGAGGKKKDKFGVGGKKKDKFGSGGKKKDKFKNRPAKSKRPGKSKRNNAKNRK